MRACLSFRSVSASPVSLAPPFGLFTVHSGLDSVIPYACRTSTPYLFSNLSSIDGGTAEPPITTRLSVVSRRLCVSMNWSRLSHTVGTAAVTCKSESTGVPGQSEPPRRSASTPSPLPLWAQEIVRERLAVTSCSSMSLYTEAPSSAGPGRTRRAPVMRAANASPAGRGGAEGLRAAARQIGLGGGT